MKGSFDIGAEYYVIFGDTHKENSQNYSFDLLNGILIIPHIQILDSFFPNDISLWARHEAFHKNDDNLGSDYFVMNKLLCTIDLLKLKELSSNYCYEYYFGKEIVQTLKENPNIGIWTKKLMLGFLERYLFSFEQVKRFNEIGIIDFNSIDPVYGNLECENIRSRSLK